MKEQGARSSFAFIVLSPLPYCTIGEREIIQRKNAFYKNEMLPKSAEAQQRTLEK
ncbi:hypothetical protein QT998_24405 [Microcoleus sp. S1D4]